MAVVGYLYIERDILRVLAFEKEEHHKEKLLDIAKKLKEEGRSQKEVYKAFEEFYVRMPESKIYEKLLLDILDIIFLEGVFTRELT